MAALADIQQLLWRLITAPEGVAAALDAADGQADGSRAALLRTVRGTGALGAVQRLDIYANMYFFRLLDVLKDEYPATLAAVGPVGFHNLVTDYLLVHPPTHFSIRHAGRSLPEFVACHRLAADMPHLGALATFEHALNDAFDAADAPTVDATALAGVPPGEWGALHLRLHPTVRLLRLQWPVHVLRERLDRGAEPGAIAAADTPLCVWRQDLQVRHRTVTAAEWQTLDALHQGLDFGGACAAAVGAGSDDDLAVMLSRAVASWVAAGMISGFTRRP